MIRIEGFSKWYGDRQVLSEIALQVERGETVGVIGKSGCGKSTLLRHIAGLEDDSTGPVGGRITLFDDTEMTSLSEKSIQARRIRGPRVGLLFQDGALFDFLDVEGNVLWPLRHHRREKESILRERALETFRMVGLEPEAAFLRRDVRGLSGGERKRVALARCLALDPEIVLYDEPTAGLDPPTAAGISALLNDLKGRGDQTSVITSHDMESTRRVADRIAWMRDGQVMFLGTYDEALQDPTVREFIEGG